MANYLSDQIYDQVIQISKALASQPRLKILNLLFQSKRTVEALAHDLGLSVPNTSHHLRVLKSAGLVESRRVGQFVCYQCSRSQVPNLWLSLREVAETRLKAAREIIQALLDDRAVDLIDRQTLYQKVKDGSVEIIDVRPKQEYLSGHLPGAISIPFEELKRRINELPKEREIVAYCRGRYCLMADEAVALLKENGFNAKRMDDGLTEWRIAGFPVHTIEEAS